MPGFDPEEPRDPIGRWTAGMATAIRNAASDKGISEAEFKKQNPHSGGALTGDPKAFNELPDNAKVWVFTATTEANANNIITNGTNKPELQDQRFPSLSNKIYVASDPRVVSGFGKVIVALKVTKSSLDLSPEAQRAKQTLGQAVTSSATGAILVDKPIEAHVVERQNTYNESSKTAYQILKQKNIL